MLSSTVENHHKHCLLWVESPGHKVVVLSTTYTFEFSEREVGMLTTFFLLLVLDLAKCRRTSHRVGIYNNYFTACLRFVFVLSRKRDRLPGTL